MSIIYDALKKVEGNLSKPKPVSESSHAPAKRTFKLIPFLAYSFAVFLAFFSMKMVYDLITRPRQAQQVKKQTGRLLNVVTAVKQPALLSKRIPALNTQEITEELPDLVLNGIFFSGGAGYALINNQILEEGDGISGLVVRKITEGDVELKTKNSVVTLSLNSSH
ncbi:MAG: hypothetical protein ISS27_03475 [Candidatus Omnitrophica bacterium]|nr:hypothetical protein [Candidatus Omnitrophota bacterium]